MYIHILYISYPNKKYSLSIYLDESYLNYEKRIAYLESLLGILYPLPCSFFYFIYLILGHEPSTNTNKDVTTRLSDLEKKLIILQGKLTQLSQYH